jgi:hypothetical protein
MAELIVEPEAEAELEEAGNRYEESVPGLGLDFLLEMRKRTLEVAEAPLSDPVFGGVADVRCAHAVGRFPHLIFRAGIWFHVTQERDPHAEAVRILRRWEIVCALHLD